MEFESSCNHCHTSVAIAQNVILSQELMALRQETAKMEPAIDALEELERSISTAQAMSEYEVPSTYLEPAKVSTHNMGGYFSMRSLAVSLQNG